MKTYQLLNTTHFSPSTVGSCNISHIKEVLEYLMPQLMKYMNPKAQLPCVQKRVRSQHARLLQATVLHQVPHSYFMGNYVSPPSQTLFRAPMPLRMLRWFYSKNRTIQASCMGCLSIACRHPHASRLAVLAIRRTLYNFQLCIHVLGYIVIDHFKHLKLIRKVYLVRA